MSQTLPISRSLGGTLFTTYTLEIVTDLEVLVPTPPPETSAFLSAVGGTLPVKHVQAIYKEAGVLLPDQPYLATAPEVMGSIIPAGSTFTLFFQSPSGGTQTTLTNGNILASFTFGLADGRVATAPVQVRSTLTSGIFQVQCTLIAPVAPSS